MKAIDFICRYLVRAAQDDLTPTARQILLAVAAGLDNSADIARLTGMSPGTCTNVLRSLAARHELHCVNRSAGFYVLGPSGKERVRHLLDFNRHA
ncbi:MAG: hypothetical protein ACI4PZ_03190 [Akkermansia sp.]